GQTAQIASQTKFVGPQSKDYTTSDKIEMANMVWSPCGAVARGNVNAQVRLEGDLTKAGQITVDSIDVELSIKVTSKWNTPVEMPICQRNVIKNRMLESVYCFPDFSYSLWST
ncbi:hypothetical protein BC833DRAFT_570439, partial [Globomyces pollinis-pini]